MKRNFIIYYLATVVFMFAASYVYEFYIEGDQMFSFLHEDESAHMVETSAEHWEYVITITIFSSIALLLPAFFAYKINLRRHETELEKLMLQIKLDEALTKLLSGFVGICCVCKKIRVEGEQEKIVGWDHVDHYIMQRTDLKFSHGYCPDCASKARQFNLDTD